MEQGKEGARSEKREKGPRVRDEPLSSQLAEIHPNPGLSSSLALKQSIIMEQKKNKMGKNPSWTLALMGTVPIPPQDSPGGWCWGQG